VSAGSVSGCLWSPSTVAFIGLAPPAGRPRLGPMRKTPRSEDSGASELVKLTQLRAPESGPGKKVRLRQHVFSVPQPPRLGASSAASVSPAAAAVPDGVGASR